MTKLPTVTEIDPTKQYNVEHVRQFLGGISLRKAKDFIRSNCNHAEPISGHPLVYGADLIATLREMSKQDSPEAKEQRRQRAGVDAREAKKAADSVDPA